MTPDGVFAVRTCNSNTDLRMMASLQRRALRASHKSIARLLQRRLMVNDTAAERQGNSSVMPASGHGPGRDRNGIAALGEEPMAQAE